MPTDPTTVIPAGPWMVDGLVLTRADVVNVYRAIERGPRPRVPGVYYGSRAWDRATRILKRHGLVHFVKGYGWEVTCAD